MVTVTHRKVSSGIVNPAVEVDLHNWNETHVVTGVRSSLSSNATYLVSKSGADTNDGITAPFLTIQAALNAVGAVDLNNFNPTISVGPGAGASSYAEALIFPVLTGNGIVTLQGDTTTPSNVEIGGSSFTGCPLTCDNPGNYVITGFRLTTSTLPYDFSASGVNVTLGALEFNWVSNATNRGARVQVGAYVSVLGTIKIVGPPNAGTNLFLSATGNAKLIFVAGTPAVNIPSAMGAGSCLFSAQDGGFIQFNTGTTFTNGANWLGFGLGVALGGMIHANVSQATIPGGSTLSNDGTGIISVNNGTIISGSYGATGAHSWTWTGTISASFDASAITASRTYALPDYAGTILLAVNPVLSGVAINASSTSGNKLLISANDSSAAAVIQRYSNDAGDPSTELWKARGTAAAPLIVNSGDNIGEFTFRAYDGAAFRAAALIKAIVDGTPGSANMPARLGFFVNPGSTGASTLAASMFHDGGINVGTSTTSPGAGNLSVANAIQPGSFTVAGLPAGATSQEVFCTNLRVFNGAGVQQGAGSGTGGRVIYNGAAWKNSDAQSVTAVA